MSVGFDHLVLSEIKKRWADPPVSESVMWSSSHLYCFSVSEAYVLDTLQMSWLMPLLSWPWLCCWPPLADYLREWKRLKGQAHCSKINSIFLTFEPQLQEIKYNSVKQQEYYNFPSLQWGLELMEASLAVWLWSVWQHSGDRWTRTHWLSLLSLLCLLWTALVNYPRI